VDGVLVVRSVRLLDQAAIDAVSLWKWEPLIIAGEAVPVVVAIRVGFFLQ